MLNNKGFTIAEVLVSFSLITIILTSIILATVYYRDRLKEEEVISQLVDFKNTITKIVYDDIVTERITRVERCVGISNCLNFVDENGNTRTMKIDEYNVTADGITRGVYLNYNGIKYMLPDSDLGSNNERVCDFVGGFELSVYDDRLYKVKAEFKHIDYNLSKELLFIIS